MTPQGVVDARACASIERGADYRLRRIGVSPVADRISKVVALVDVHHHRVGLLGKSEVLEDLDVLVGADAPPSEVVGRAIENLGELAGPGNLWRGTRTRGERVADCQDIDLGRRVAPVGQRVAEAVAVEIHGLHRAVVSVAQLVRREGLEQLQLRAVVVPGQDPDLRKVGETPPLGDLEPGSGLELLEQAERDRTRENAQADLDHREGDRDGGAPAQHLCGEACLHRFNSST